MGAALRWPIKRSFSHRASLASVTALTADCDEKSDRVGC